MLRFPDALSWFGLEKATMQRTQLSQSYGWGGLKKELDTILPAIEAERGENCTILVDNHARAGMVAWLLDAPERVMAEQSTRTNQYHLWRDEENEPLNYCLYILTDDDTKQEQKSFPGALQLAEGLFFRQQVLTTNNPDGTTRRFGIYRIAGE
jgi:hypothetical protein